MLQAIGRNNRLAARPEILGTIRKLIAQPEAAPSSAARSSNGRPRLTRKCSRCSTRPGRELSQPQRLEAIEVLFGRPALLDRSEPSESALKVLRRGVTDSSPAVRERTLRGISSLPALWSGRAATTLLLSALADDTPALRRQGLTLGAPEDRLVEPARRPRASEAAARRSRRPGARAGAFGRRAKPAARGHRKGEHEDAGPGAARQGASRRPGAESPCALNCSPPTASIPARWLPTSS